MSNLSGLTKRRYWPLLLAGWIATLVLGHWGFTIYFREQGEIKTFVDIAYLDLQLYKLSGGSVSGHVPWQLNIARIAAPSIAAIAIFRAMFLFLGDRVRESRVRRLRNHIIVCGAGEAGVHIAASARDAGLKAVVIDRESGTASLDKWKAQGGFYIAGDMSEPETLRAAAVQRARALVAVSGDDGKNANIALSARRALEKTKRETPLVCHVQLIDYDLSSLFRSSPLFRDTSGVTEMRVMNAYDTAARVASSAHPLDRETIGADDPRVPQLILLGFGRMGASLALQYAKIAHYANGRPLEIAVFDRAASMREKAFLARHPGLKNICALRFHECAFDDASAIEEVCSLACRPNALSTVAICLDGDSQSLAFGLAVQTALRGTRVPILVRMSSKNGLAALLGDAPPGGQLVPFGMLEQVCDWTALDSEPLDRLAKEVHRLYQLKREAEGAAETAVLPPWRELDPTLQDSCRQQADHLPIKLRTLRCVVENGAGAPIEFRADEIEILARMEHRRWVAERFLAGWRPGPKDNANKITPYLVDYDLLDDTIKDYDRDTVRNLPRLIEMAGGHIRRV